MRETLLDIELLLRRHGFADPANLAEIAAVAYARSPRKAYPILLSGEWWGGGNRVAAVDLAVAAGFTPQARCYGQALRTALVEVFRELREAASTDEQIALAARHFRKWSLSGILGSE